MVKRIVLFLAVVFTANLASAQTIEELKANLATKQAALAEAKANFDALTGEVDALKTEIANLSGWQLGGLATLGLNFSQFDNWFSAVNPDAYSSQFGIAGNLFANRQNPKYFWKNGLSVVATKTKLVFDKGARKDQKFETTADAININSLYGYKLNSKWAISALGDYRSTIVDNFNSPGYLDLGVGATWTPIKDATVVIHPLNYNFVFSDNNLTYESSLGAKIVADYTRKLPMGIGWKTNLSSFVSYSDTPNLSNWVWTNGLSFTAWKGIGVGIDFGLKGNKQESYNKFLRTSNQTAKEFPIGDLKNVDNPIQKYWVVGLTYKI